MLELSPTEWTAIQLSLRVAAVATLVATPLGIAIAWLLARRDFWGKAVVDALIHLPLVLPPVVTGYLLLLTFGRRGLVGAWLADHLGIVFAFRWTGAALACGIMSFPLLVRPIRLSIEAIDRRLEQAAEPKFAMAESVRAALTLVARGEAALGIVYSTDAKVEPGVKIVGTFPTDSHPAIIYPVAATTTAKPEVADYLAFLRSSAAKAIFEKYGFKFLVSPTT